MSKSRDWVKDWEELKKKIMFIYGFGVSLLHQEGLMGTGEVGVAVIVHSNKRTVKNGKKKVEGTSEMVGLDYDEKSAIKDAFKSLRNKTVKSRDPTLQKAYWPK